ncbi:AAA domain-containing protein [Roseivirga sp.]|uniref:AAA domain-containing protein n=1 Tax=Roseivirga sp. TaxID=1964215 RepID=UPI002B266AD8|nr:AAA domain-containing protein [Roseivirga sp.]
MGFHSYLVEKFNTTHENRFFRHLNSKLNQAFSDKDGSHVLIGNVSVDGQSLDAIFIKRGAIIVIDFKDYSGELTFSENGPWKIKYKNQLVFVSGGAVSRNPFQQVKAYRFSLFPLLNEKESEILEPNHTVNWDHTNAMILFHGDIRFDSKEIPDRAKRFFHITDFKNIVRSLNDCYSDKLELSDTEIDNILKVLNVGFETLYSDDEDLEDSQALESNSLAPVRLDRIRQIIPDEAFQNDFVKALSFYYSMIGIERMKDSEISEVHQFPIDWSKVEPDYLTINLEQNESFHDVFRKNQSQRFPKNLFLSIDFLMEGKQVPLLYNIIVSSEIDDIREIRVNLNDFILFKKILQELDLTEDTIEELTVLINEAENLDKRIFSIREYLDVSLERLQNLSLGLSSESIYTSQMQAELRHLIVGKTAIEGELFKQFILGQEIKNYNKKQITRIIPITPLNQSQRKAIDLGLNQPLTVITGPPGTGKSQVVSNLIANIIYNGKTVLFASKNNKAVDNVQERLSDLLDTDYFLRLGSFSQIEKLSETLGGIISDIKNDSLDDFSFELKESKQHMNSIFDEVRSKTEKIESIPIIEKELEILKTKENILKKDYTTWLENKSPKLIEAFIENAEKIQVTKNELNELQNEIQKANTGLFSRLRYSLFKKKNVKDRVAKINNELPEIISRIVDDQAPAARIDLDEGDAFLANLELIRDLREEEDLLKDDHSKKTKALKDVQKKTNSLKKTLAILEENKEKFIARISELKNEIQDKGIELLQYFIHEELRNADTRFISEYLSYAKNGLPKAHFDDVDDFNLVASKFLSVFKAISITNLSIKKAFLQEAQLFDYLIIDEATQCDIASAIPMIYRAKQVVILGDPLQLPHITSVKKHEQDFVRQQLELPNVRFNYIENSLFSHCDMIAQKSGFDSVFLEEHYRCHPDIIGFSNRYFYLPKAGQELVVKTNKNDFKYGKPGIHWIDVVGEVEAKNRNKAEAAKCTVLVQTLIRENPKASIGVVTPFKDQKRLLEDKLENERNSHDLVIDTVHRFQGDEKDIMVLSIVLTNGSRPSLANFINEYQPYLLNVAITRARSALYIVGNKDYCRSLKSGYGGASLLGRLVDYVDQLKNSSN